MQRLGLEDLQVHSCHHQELMPGRRTILVGCHPQDLDRACLRPTCMGRGRQCLVFSGRLHMAHRRRDIHPRRGRMLLLGQVLRQQGHRQLDLGRLLAIRRVTRQVILLRL